MYSVSSVLTQCGEHLRWLGIHSLQRVPEKTGWHSGMESVGEDGSVRTYLWFLQGLTGLASLLSLLL